MNSHGGYKGGRGTAERIGNFERGGRVDQRPDFRQEQQAAQNDRTAFHNAPQRQQRPPAGPIGPSPDFEILNLRRLQGDGPTRAFFSVAVHISGERSNDPLLLHDCRLVVNRDGEPFCAMAQREWTDGQGQKKYSPNTELPKSWRGPLLDAVIDACGGWPLS